MYDALSEMIFSTSLFFRMSLSSLFIIVYCSGVIAQEHLMTTAQFISKIHENTDQYSKSIKCIDGDIDVVYDKNSPLKGLVDFRIRNAQDEQSGLHGISYRTSPAKDSISGYNGDYSFDLSKNVKNGKWILSDLVVDNGTLNRKNLAHKIRHYSMLPYAIGVVHNLRDISMKKSFAVTESTISNNNKDHLMIKYTISDIIPSDYNYGAITGGTIVLDRSNMFRVVECSTDIVYLLSDDKTKRIERIRIMNKYSSTSKMPLIELQDIVLDTYGPDGSKVAVNRKNICNYNVNSEDASIFRVSKYGIVEPTYKSKSQDSRIPWHMYVTLLGIICMIIATIILYRCNKQAAV